MGKCGKVARLAVFVAMMAGPALAAECGEDQVHLKGDWGQARFSVEVADDRAERNRGLMNREKLPMSAGMLFVYNAPTSVSFWMRNTLIPLDMIFMDSTGTVQRVHSNAVPLDQTPIFGGNNIQYVLEINGGLAERMGIEVGSVLQHPAIDPARAAWPC